MRCRNSRWWRTSTRARIPGRLARYYAALCLEDLDKENQALEELKKISNGSDKELASMAQYQTGGVVFADGQGR